MPFHTFLDFISARITYVYHYVYATNKKFEKNINSIEEDVGYLQEDVSKLKTLNSKYEILNSKIKVLMSSTISSSVNKFHLMDESLDDSSDDLSLESFQIVVTDKK